MPGIGERLRMLRGKLSQGDFALKFGIHRNTLARWESGEREPDVAFLVQLAAQEGIAHKWLLTGLGTMYEEAVSLTSEPSDCVKMKRADTSAFEKMQHPEITEHGKGQKADRQPLAHEEELNSLNKELRDLLRQNGDLRVEVERLRARVRDLERELREALKPEGGAAPVASTG